MIETLFQFADPQSCATIVLKIGSALLVDPDGQLQEGWLRSVVGEIAEMQLRGQRVVVVSSGAIALGAARLGWDRALINSLSQAQAAASVGQIALAQTWSALLEECELRAAQMLLTLDDLEDRGRYLNASATLSCLLEFGVVPVVNENDSVATAEIRFGDNDRLAARVAQAAGAQGVILLSDVEGLLDRPPHDPEAQLVSTVRGVTQVEHAMASAGSTSGLGAGGMRSKLQAAQIAERAGIALAIINGTHQRPISRAIDNGVGTVFVPQLQEDARRSWLAGRIASRGSVTIDRGCHEALNKGASLLAAGVIEVTGDFRRGDLISIADGEGPIIAQGLAEYDADECRKIMGRQHAQQAGILGHAPRSAVVHRNHMVMR